MVGTQTSAERAFVRDFSRDLAPLADELLAKLSGEEAREMRQVLRRVPQNADRAIALDDSWMRSSLASSIRGDLLDLQRCAMRHHEPVLAAVCGEKLHLIDRRAQMEASPVFDREC